MSGDYAGVKGDLVSLYKKLDDFSFWRDWAVEEGLQQTASRFGETIREIERAIGDMQADASVVGESCSFG